jgi:hypothetical protein
MMILGMNKKTHYSLMNKQCGFEHEFKKPCSGKFRLVFIKLGYIFVNILKIKVGQAHLCDKDYNIEVIFIDSKCMIVWLMTLLCFFTKKLLFWFF